MTPEDGTAVFVVLAIAAICISLLVWLVSWVSLRRNCNRVLALWKERRSGARPVSAYQLWQRYCDTHGYVSVESFFLLLQAMEMKEEFTLDPGIAITEFFPDWRKYVSLQSQLHRITVSTKVKKASGAAA